MSSFCSDNSGNSLPRIEEQGEAGANHETAAHSKVVQFRAHVGKTSFNDSGMPGSKDRQRTSAGVGDEVDSLAAPGPERVVPMYGSIGDGSPCTGSSRLRDKPHPPPDSHDSDLESSAAQSRVPTASRAKARLRHRQIRGKNRTDGEHSMTCFLYDSVCNIGEVDGYRVYC